MKALGSTLLEGRDLELRRGEALALRLPVFALREGEILGLIGPNGAGKSTLLLCLAGLLPPTQGRLQFRGSELVSRAQLQAYRRRATLVFQEPLLLDTSVEANLSAGLRLRGLSRAERQRRVGQAAERFGITHLLDRPARDLSGGEAQRTSLARACALEPEVLLLDEPFSALDPPTREALLRDLGRTLAETGCTAVFATHDLMEALQLANTLMVLRAGEVTQQGPIEAVVNHPLDEFVATFVGMETLLTGPVVEKGAGTFAVALGGQRIIGTGEVDLGQELTLGIRPENVTLALHPESDTSARNQFQARVTRITSRGPFFRVELECGFFLSAYVTARSRQELGLVEGRPVFASFKATAVHLIRK